MASKIFVTESFGDKTEQVKTVDACKNICNII